MALSEDILKLKDVFNGANPLQAGIDKAGGTLQLPNVQDIQAPQVAAPQPLMTPEFLAQREVDRGPMEDASMGGAIAGAAKSGFDFLFGAPTPEQAQDILNTQPTDAAQRARLQETAAGRGQPSDISQIGSFFFGRPDVAGDPNILGNQPTTPVAPQAGELGAVAQVAPSRPSSPAMDGSQIPKFGEEGFQFAERGSPQDFFLSQTKDGTQSLSQEQIERGQSFAQQKGMNFDPTTGFSVGEQPPVSQGLTTQGGQPLAEFLAGGQQLDPQGRMIDPSVDRSFFEQESAAREARAAEQFGVPRGPDSRDRDRRGTMSKADAVKLTGGDRVAADALLKRQELGLGEFAPERAEQTGLTPEQDLAERKFELDKAKFVDSVIAREGASAPLSPAQKKFAEEAGKGAYEWDQGGRAGAQENINKFQTVLTDLEDGNLDTRTLTEFAPFIGDWARAAINPTGQQGLDTIRGVIFQGLRDTLGAQFTEREGERLVKAAYNPQVNEEMNIARLEPALDRMKATFAAKEALTQHIMQGGSVQDYKGITPWEAYQGKGQPQGSSAQSPIEGDVDVAGEADKILSSL